MDRRRREAFQRGLVKRGVKPMLPTTLHTTGFHEGCQDVEANSRALGLIKTYPTIYGEYMDTLSLAIPPEPRELKERALNEAGSPGWSFLGRDSVYNIFVLGSGGLPKYLWSFWKPQLKSAGLSWPVFLKAISACAYSVHEWLDGRRSWDELVDGVIIPVLRKAVQGRYPLWPP